MQAELKGNPKNSGNRSQIRSLQRDQVQEPAKDGGCGIHSFPLPCRPSAGAAGDPGKLAETPGLNQDKISRIEQGTDTYISSLAGYLEALADK